MGIEDIPPQTLNSIQDYVEHGLPPGDFLTAVLENDLKEAFGRADDQNRPALFDIVAYCRNRIPAVCWGSNENVTEWMKEKAEAREKQ